MNASILLKGGLFWVTLAYVLWGLTPLFYQHLRGVDALEIFASRVLFAVPLLSVLLVLSGTPVRVFKLLSQPRTLCWLFLSTACISTSWYLNTWGATHGQVLMVSLAFFLTPLVSILIGVFYLRERLTPLQCVALVFCTAGFLYACTSLDSFPWLTVGIAVAFGSYGVIKKQVPIDPLNGLAAESLLMLPFALYYLNSPLAEEMAWATNEGGTRLLLAMVAPIVLLPLGLFSFGVARLQNLSTIAVLQYIEPTLYFLLAVFVFGEAIDMSRMTTFILVWTGFILFSIDALRRARVAQPAVTTPS